MKYVIKVEFVTTKHVLATYVYNEKSQDGTSRWGTNNRALQNPTRDNIHH